MSEQHQGGLPPIEELDVGGDIREAAEKVDGHTRAAFLAKAGVTGGAVLGAGALGGALLGSPDRARGQGGGGDIAILNFAYVLELLEAAFYDEANEKGALDGELANFSREVAETENAHADLLRTTIRSLGGTPAATPTLDFKGTTESKSSFTDTAITLEDTGVTAYAGQAANISSDKILTTAAQILAVEARHAAWIRELKSGSGNSPSPSPFVLNPTQTVAEVLAAVRATGFVTANGGAATAGSANSGQPGVAG